MNFDHGIDAIDLGADDMPPATPTYRQARKCALVAAARFDVLTARQVLALPPAEWLLHGLLPKSGLAAIFGDSSSGKSFLSIDLAATIASGAGEWFGLPCNTASVVYCCLEGQGGFVNRLTALSADRAGISDRLRFIFKPFDLTSNARAIADSINAAGGAGVVFIDTLNACTAGIDENSPSGMGEILNALRFIQESTGALVILVHHTTKATGAIRGHGSLRAALDGAIEVKRDNGRRTFTAAKAKDGPDGMETAFRLEVVDLGTDGAGNSITSCVVAEDRGEGGIQSARLPAGGNKRAVWEALGELLKKSGPTANPPRLCPPGRPAVRLEQALEHCRGRLIEIDPKRQTERAKAALTALQNDQLIVVHEGWVWLP